MAHADPVPTPHPQDERRSTRVAVNAVVSLRRSGGHHYKVRAFDASQHGCKLEFVERPTVDERVWVKFDGLEAVEGLVSWIEGFEAGIEFVRPLHSAVFQTLSSRFR